MSELESEPASITLFKRIAEFSPELHCVADLESGHFRWLSESWRETLGWSLEDLTSRPFLSYVHPDDVESTRREVAHLIGGGRTVTFENRYRAASGAWVWLQWNALPPTPEGLVAAVARDVTRARSRELQVAEQKAVLELAAELAGVCHWHIDMKTNRLHWSDEVFRIHGFEPGAFEPSVEQAVSFYHPGDRERVARHVEEAIAHRRPFDFELRLVRADGETRTVASRGRIQLDGAGEPVALFGIFQDVTEAGELQRRLERSERMASLGTLAAGVAHEINNPLTYVLGNLQLLHERLADRPDLQQLAEEALQGGEHVRRTVGALKGFSRESGGVREALDLAALLDDAVRLSQNTLRHRGELVQDRRDDGCRVSGERTPLVQVVVNLLVNAAQALPEDSPGHRITLRTRVEGRCAVIEVEDTGVGIAPELQSRVFDPFFTTRSVGEGIGLGLAICHQTVARHDGALSVESRPGRTCFRVELPLALADDASEPPPQAPEAGTSGERVRILVIDDEPLVARFLVRGLQTSNFEVTHASDPEAGVALALAQAFELIVCDLMMPTLNGWEVHARLAAADPGLAPRILFVTGGAFSPAAARFLAEVPPEHVLEKPFRSRELVARIQALLQR